MESSEVAAHESGVETVANPVTGHRPRLDPRRPLKRTIYPPVVGQAFQMTAQVRVAMWDRALRRVRDAQESTLLGFVRHAQDTEYGRRYGFSTIRRYEDYRSRVPVGDYDSFFPAIERMRKGERGVLVPELNGAVFTTLSSRVRA